MKGSMKKMNQKKISACLAAVLTLTSCAFASAETQESNIHYEYRFNDASDGNIFSGEGSTVTVSDGVCRIDTQKPVNSAARQVYATLDKSIHTVAENETDTLEVKVKFEKNTKKYLFGARDNSDPANQKTNSTLLKFKNDAGTQLTGSDDVYFSSDITMPSGKWHQLYFVFDNDKYTLFIDGKTACKNVNLNGKNDVAVAQIDQFLFQGNGATKVDQVTYIDDIIAQKLVPVYLSQSSIADGADNIPAETEKLTLDFNTVIDSASLDSITVKAGERALDKSEYSAEVNASDATCIDVSFVGSLQGGTVYTVDYSGVKDAVNADGNNTASGSVSFTTEQKTIPFEILSSEPLENAETNAAVTVNFNKAVDAGTLKNISIAPQAEFAAAANGTSVIITPVYNWCANKEYTVSFDGVCAADGSTFAGKAEISFKTVENPYSAAPVNGDVSWYAGNKVNSAKAKAMGVCGVSYNKAIKPIENFNNQSSILPFYWQSSLGKDDDTVASPVLYMKSKAAQNALVFKTEKGLGTFTLKTAEKTYSGSGEIELYTAPTGADFTDDSVYTKAEFVKSGEISDKWNSNVTYTVTANNADIGYVKAVVSRQGEETNFVSVYSPAILGAEISPYEAESTAAYKAVNRTYNTIDVIFDGLLDKSSVSADKFSVEGNGVLSAKIADSDSAYQQTVRLTVADELKDNAEYSVNVGVLSDIFGNAVSEKTLSFTASNAPVSFTSANKSDTGITGKINVPSVSKYVGHTANLIAAYYVDGKLSNITVSGITLKSGENAFEAAAAKENETAVLMLWTDINGAVPISAAKTAE